MSSFTRFNAHLRWSLLFLSPLCFLNNACLESSCEDTTALQARLDRAAPGETVTIGSCTFTGPIRVPRGIELLGSGSKSTTIVASPGENALILTPDSKGTSIRNLTIRSEGCSGIVVRGEGHVSITDVDLHAQRGVGIAVEDTTQISMKRLSVVGPITSENADTTIAPHPPFRCGSSSLATHGIVLVDIPSASLSDVDIEGFAAFGFLSLRSSIEWEAGTISTTLGAGIEIWGGEATLHDLTLSGIRDGQGAIESFGGAFGGGAIIRTQNVLVEDGDSFGFFHDESSAVHENLVARNNRFAAIWVQRTDSFVLRGSTRLENNGFAGVAALDSRGILLQTTTINQTSEAIRVSGIRTIRAADGIHMVNSEGLLQDIILRDNERTGLLLDLANASTSTVTLGNISVEASGTSLGAIAQNGRLESGWDENITRLGDTASNDASFSGTLSIADAVGPVCFPPLDRLDTDGIQRLIER